MIKLGIKSFSASPGVISNIAGFGKDVGRAVWNRRGAIKSSLVMAGIGAASGYGINKAIQKDAERLGAPLKGTTAWKKQQEQLRGLRGAQKEFGLSGLATKAGKGLWNNKGMLAMSTAFAALPTIGYLSERKQLKEQGAATRAALARSKSYPTPTSNPSSLVPYQTTHSSLRQREYGINSVVTKGLSGASSWLGGGGREGVSNLSKEFLNSKNPITQRVGKFLGKYTKTALAGSILVGGGISAKAFDLGDKMVKKPMKMIDKDAYAYERSKEQKLN